MPHLTRLWSGRDHGRKGPEHNGANKRVHWPETPGGPGLSLLQLMKWSSTKSRGRITPDLDFTLECVDLPRFGTNISALTSPQIGGAVAVADDAPTSFSLKLCPRRICTIGDPITVPTKTEGEYHSKRDLGGIN